VKVPWGSLVILCAAAVFGVGCGSSPSSQAGEKPPSMTDGGGEAFEEGPIAWIHDFDAGMAKAKESGKPMMIDVFATWCAPCKRLDETVFSRADVAQASSDFVAIKLDGDKYPQVREKLGVTGYPTVVFLSPDGNELLCSKGAVPYQNMLESMAKAKDAFDATP